MRTVKKVRLKNPKLVSEVKAIERFGDKWFHFVKANDDDFRTAIVGTHSTIKESCTHGDIRWWDKDDIEDIDTDRIETDSST